MKKMICMIMMMISLIVISGFALVAMLPEQSVANENVVKKSMAVVATGEHQAILEDSDGNMYIVKGEYKTGENVIASVKENKKGDVTDDEIINTSNENFADYEKTVADEYGYNKGECNREYLHNEEYFYNEYYDHYNVDVVYDKEVAYSADAEQWRKENIEKIISN